MKINAQETEHSYWWIVDGKKLKLEINGMLKALLAIELKPSS